MDQSIDHALRLKSGATVKITDGKHKDRIAKVIRRNGNTTRVQFASDFQYAWVRTALLAAEVAEAV